MAFLMKLQEIKKIIDKNFPDLKLETIEKVGEGMESVAYLVNENFIFRFPKNEYARKSLQREIFALPKIRRRLKLEIPDFKFVDKKANFVGYPKICGEDLTSEIFASLTKKEQAEIQQSLAEFLMAIHQTDVSDFPPNGIEIQDFFAAYKSDFREIKEKVFPFIECEERDFIAEKFDEYLSDKNNFSDDAVLLHNDLSADHILFDRAEKKIKGIIDFGDIAIGDADYDLMYLLDDYDEDFVRAFLRFYPHPDHERLFDKLYFWNLANILQLIIYYEAEKNRREIEKLIENLRDWIRLMKAREFSAA